MRYTFILFLTVTLATVSGCSSAADTVLPSGLLNATIAVKTESGDPVQGADILMTLDKRADDPRQWTFRTDQNGECLVYAGSSKGWHPITFVVTPPAGSSLQAKTVSDSAYFYLDGSEAPRVTTYAIVLGP